MASADHQGDDEDEDGHSLTEARRVFPTGDGIECGDVVIIGAGLAGLFTALKLAPMPVTVISAAPLGEAAASVWAQGGIAAAVGEGDSPGAHARDTINAGAGLVDPGIAALVTREGPARIEDLLGYGVPFDRDPEGRLVLSREAAHSARRIVRVSGDRAGRAIMTALIRAAQETPSIRVLENYKAKDLVLARRRVAGVRLARTGAAPSKRLEVLRARAVVLATGGIGHLYAVTTNPSHANGEAVAMAARAGAIIADADFVQFHPTAIDIGRDPAPLATEALRGEGAILVNGTGERFMTRVHENAELAPRDVVARAVHREIASGRGAFLDCRKAIGERFSEAFPTVHEICRAAGINPARELIPVAPAAHYHMGGVHVDPRGRTSVDRLWACGEVAATGLHGANRLASNSLLEAVVFGARVAEDIAGLDPIRRHESASRQDLTVPRSEGTPNGTREGAIRRLRAAMSKHVGVVRSGESLRGALRVISEIEDAAGCDITLASMALTAKFVTVAAFMREESRGSHFRSDFPRVRLAFAHRIYLTAAEVAQHAGELLAGASADATDGADADALPPSIGAPRS